MDAHYDIRVVLRTIRNSYSTTVQAKGWWWQPPGFAGGALVVERTGSVPFLLISEAAFAGGDRGGGAGRARHAAQGQATDACTT
jgi:hypothetical protein